MEEVVWADRIAVFNKGEIVLEGSPKEIFMEDEKLEKWGLSVPLVTKLSKCLVERGFEIPHPILTIEELSVWL